MKEKKGEKTKKEEEASNRAVSEVSIRPVTKVVSNERASGWESEGGRTMY